MSVPTNVHEIRHGDLEKVALRLAFFEDEYAEPHEDEDLVASWGEFSLWVGGVNVTEQFEWGETREGFRWYLLPLLEWLAQNWDPLLHEERLQGVPGGPDAASSLSESLMPGALTYEEAAAWFETRQLWLQRHAIRSASLGGRFPELFLRRHRGAVELSWHHERRADGGFTAEGGRALHDSAYVGDVLYRTLLEAERHLSGVRPASPRIAQLGQRIDSLKSPSRRDARLAWLAGLGRTASEVADGWSRLFGAAERAAEDASEGARRALLGKIDGDLVLSGSCRAALLFGSMSPTITGTDARTIARLLVESYAPDMKCPLDEFGPVEEPEGEPWRQGQLLAEAVHERWQIDVEQPVSIGTLVKDSGVKIVNVRLSDTGARAVCFASDEHVPTVAINGNYETNRRKEVRRFTLAHELCHLLFDREFGHDVAIASGPWAPADIEKRANAFAAMFLMPRALVRKAIAAGHHDPYTLEWAAEIAGRMGTSITTTIDHLYNLNQIDSAVRAKLWDSLGYAAHV
jgi:Zn-dependent peptidase ImmA (M78 family)